MALNTGHHRTRRLLVLLAMTWYVTPIAAQTAVATLDPAWSKTYPTDAVPPSPPEPVSIALATNGRCLAVAGSGAVEVLDSGGRPLWRWDYGRASRYIRPGATFGDITDGAIAVSPACDTIAIVGYPGYRYTWVANRRGQRVSIKTTSTPLSVAFDRRGDQLAIGTGGSDVLLYSKTGQLKWKRTLENWCCVVRQLSFSRDNRSILVRGWGIGVLRTDGTVVWTDQASGMAAADDLRTFVAWWEPSHGPGIGHVTAADEAQNELWRKVASWPQAVISPAGDRIVARINENQNPTEYALADEQDTSLQVLARNGDVVATLPVKEGSPVAISPDGRRVIVRTRSGVEEVDLQGNLVFEIPIERGGSASVMVAEDFSGMLILQTHRDAKLQWYSLKQPPVR